MIVVVTRAFLLAGERQEVGRLVDLPDALAREMMALNKAAPAPLVEPDNDVATTPATSDKPTKRPRKGQP